MFTDSVEYDRIMPVGNELPVTLRDPRPWIRGVLFYQLVGKALHAQWRECRPALDNSTSLGSARSTGRSRIISTHSFTYTCSNLTNVAHMKVTVWHTVKRLTSTLEIHLTASH